MRQYVVYENPSDFPNRIVVRGFTITEQIAADAEPLYVGMSMREARDAIERADPNVTRINRSPGDEPQIREVWL